jgi:hypothetical protein
VKKIGIGYEEYKEFIDDDMYYIDKTMLIKDVVERGGKVTLFTRPRRFGKTLALSMLRTFFELEYDYDGNVIDKRRYFEGKKIMNADEKILDMMESMETLGGDVLKIAVTPNKEFDVRRVLELLDKLKAGGYKDYRITKPVVIISMGDMGKKSRFCLGEKGSLFTFAYVGEESAPGQVELGEIFKKLA